MIDFKDVSLSEDYLHPYCLMQGYRGLVFVEGLRDITFWDDILNKGIEGPLYHIMNVTDDGDKGKPVLKKHMHHANKFAIFAMDSDFDYVCPNNNECSQFINSNDYILQTFVYSKESVTLHYSIVDDCISKFKISSDINFSIKNYLLLYSKEIFSVLKMFLFLKDKKIELDDSLFHKVIKPAAIVFDANFNVTNDVFLAMKATISDYEVELLKFSIDDVEYREFEQSLYDKGLNEENAYQFVNGHHLENNVVMPVISAIIKNIKSNEMELIKQQCKNKPQLIDERRRELFNYIDSEKRFPSLLQGCKDKFITPCLQKIKDQIASC